MAERTFEFVGGPADGQKIIVGEPFSIGTPVIIPSKDGQTVSVYHSSPDGRFHYQGVGPKPLPGNTAPDERVQPIMHAISGLLKQLDGIYVGKGYPAAFTFKMERGEWVLTRRM